MRFLPRRAASIVRESLDGAAHCSSIRDSEQDHPRARRIVVCLESRRRTIDDGLEVFPVKAFIDELPALL